MFKISSKSFTQQRAALKPMKNSAIYEEEDDDEEEGDNIINQVVVEEGEEEDEDEDEIFMEDGSSSCYSNHHGAVTTHDTRNETMLLAQFLSTTGPEEYSKDIIKGDSKAQQQFKRASRLLSRLRKRPTMPVLRSGPMNNNGTSGGSNALEPTMKKNYIPLPVYEAPDSNDHGENRPNNNTTTTKTAREHNNNHRNTTTTHNKITHTHTNTTKNNPPIITPKTSTSNSNTTSNNNHNQYNNYNNSHNNHYNNYNNNYNNQNNHKSNNKKLSAVQLRDSGIYSEASDRDFSVVSSTTATASTIPIPPLPQFLNDLQQFPQPPYVNKNSNNSPRRPAPMPPALASAALAACSPTSVCSNTTTLRSVPEAALKRRSVRLRHVQVQTEMGTQTTTSGDDDQKTTLLVPNTKPQGEDKQACPHCRQIVSGTNTVSSGRIRRPSCPPALSSGPVLSAQEIEEQQTDAKKLLAMIMNLKSQLAEEKQCRLKLEKAMYQRHSEDRREVLAKEKDRWAGDCLWLNDRIALLPE